MSTKTEHTWHHSIDKKYCFLHIKFEVRLFIYLTRKAMTNKKKHFSWGMIHPFSKGRRLKQSAAFWFFELKDARNTWCLCIRVQKEK
jgi:hypothetical protein